MVNKRPMRKTPPSRERHIGLPPLFPSLRYISGAIFLVAGAFKLLMPLRGESFGELLATLHVPCPTLAGLLVPLLEISGGFALLRRYQLKLFAPLLAIDMIFAIALIGGPGRLGHTLTVSQHHAPPITTGDEPWRLPLEIGLLVAMLVVFYNEFPTDSRPKQ